jgi:hypothetical protein
MAASGAARGRSADAPPSREDARGLGSLPRTIVLPRRAARVPEPRNSPTPPS